MRRQGSYVPTRIAANYADRMMFVNSADPNAHAECKFILMFKFNTLRGVLAPLAALVVQGVWRRHVMRERARGAIQRAVLKWLYRPKGWAETSGRLAMEGLLVCGV